MKRKTIYVAIIVIFVFCTCIACSKKGNQPSYVYKTGESLRYKFWMSQQTEIEDSEVAPQRILVRFFSTITPESKNGDITTLNMTIENTTASISADKGRKPLNQFKGLNKLSFKIKQHKNGKILEINRVGKVPADIEVYSKTLNQTIREIFPNLPERLTQGTSWHRNSVISNDTPGYGTLTSTTKTAFTAGTTTKLNGYNPIEIAADFTLNFNSEDNPKGQPNPSSKFISNGTGRGVYYFDPTISKLIGVKYDTKVIVSTEMEQDNMMINKSHTVKSHIEFQLVSITPKASKDVK